jgi:DNA-binding transcriptional MocR family regulator
MKPLPAPKSPKPGEWVQTERAAHEAFAALIGKSPLAAKIMHALVSRVADHNAVVISQGVLADIVGASRQGVQKALKILERDRWIEIRQVGDRATVNAYVVNDRVAWFGDREGRKYSLFSATVIVSSEEQADADSLDDLHRKPLRKLPMIYPGERQLPTGDGLPPPSQPSFPGLEPDLPARQADPEQMDLEDLTGQALPSR